MTTFNTPTHPCAGDCGGDQEVTVNEIITLVNIALGSANVSVCEAADANGDGEITVDEIIPAVNAALIGCGVAFEEATVVELPAAMEAGRATALDLVEQYIERSNTDNIAPPAPNSRR